MIKSAKLNFLLLLLTCGLAMPSKIKAYTIRDLHRYNTLTIVASAINYYVTKKTAGLMELPENCYQLLPDSNKRDYIYTQKHCTNLSKLSIASGLTAITGSILLEKYRKHFNITSQSSIFTPLMGMLTILSFGAQVLTLPTSILMVGIHKKLEPKQIKAIFSAQPTEETITILLANSMHINDKNIDRYVEEEPIEKIISMPLLHDVILHTKRPNRNNLINFVMNLPGININAQDSKGNTALHIAAKKRDVKSIELLLEKEAETAIPNKAGLTAQQCIGQALEFQVPKDLEQAIVTKATFDKEQADITTELTNILTPRLDYVLK